MGRTDSLRVVVLGAVAALLAACAGLPTRQTAGFKALADASGGGLAAVSAAQADDLATEQLALVAQGRKTLSPSPGCFAADDSPDPCLLVVADPAAVDPTPPITLGDQTVRTRRLLARIDAYARGMDELAQAKDVDDAAAQAGKVAASLQGLAAAVVPAATPAAGAAAKAIAIGVREYRTRQRRALLLRLASTADPLIARSAEVMGEEATQLRDSLLDVRKRRLRQALEALDAYGAKPDADPDKAAAARRTRVAEVAAAAAAVDRARAIRTDFTPLARAHAALLDSLTGRRDDPTAGVADAQAFQDVVQSMSGLASSPPAK